MQGGMLGRTISAPNRKCAATGRDLAVGESVHSLLREVGGKFVRDDYSAEGWQAGVPEADRDAAIAYWSGKIAPRESAKKPVIQDGILLECFHHLQNANEPSKIQFRYVLALLLMRRKKLRFEDARKADGQEVLTLRDAKGANRHEVIDPHMNEEEMIAVQTDLFQVLGWE